MKITSGPSIVRGEMECNAASGTEKDNNRYIFGQSPSIPSFMDLVADALLSKGNLDGKLPFGQGNGGIWAESQEESGHDAGDEAWLDEAVMGAFAGYGGVFHTNMTMDNPEVKLPYVQGTGIRAESQGEIPGGVQEKSGHDAGEDSWIFQNAMGAFAGYGGIFHTNMTMKTEVFSQESRLESELSVKNWEVNSAGESVATKNLSDMLSKATSGTPQAEPFTAESNRLAGAAEANFAAGREPLVFETEKTEIPGLGEKNVTQEVNEAVRGNELFQENDQASAEVTRLEEWDNVISYHNNAAGEIKPGDGISPVYSGNSGVEKMEPYSQIGREILDKLEGNRPVEFRMQLTPETLGPVDVKLKIDQGKLIIDIVAASAKTQELLASQVDKLVQSMGLQDVKIEHVQIHRQIDLFDHYGERSTQTMGEGMDSSQGKQQRHPRKQNPAMAYGSIQNGNESVSMETVKAMEAMRYYASRMDYMV